MSTNTNMFKLFDLLKSCLYLCTYLTFKYSISQNTKVDIQFICAIWIISVTYLLIIYCERKYSVLCLHCEVRLLNKSPFAVYNFHCICFLLHWTQFCLILRHMLPWRGPSICMLSVTLHPAKAIAQTEMPFGREARVAASNIVLDRGPGLPRVREDFGVSTCSLQHCHLSPDYFGPRFV